MFGFGGGNQVKVSVVGDASQLKREMGTARRDIDGFAGKTEGRLSKMSSFIKGALVVGAGAAIAGFAKDSVRAYSDLNESLNAVEVSFGDSAEEVKRLGENAAQNLGLSNAEFNGFAVQLSAFAKQIAGDSGDVAGTIDTMTTRVSDFASVMNLDVAEAAEKFQSGLAGETEPLRKFGIDLSAARVKAFALSEGIIDVGDTMTEGEKVQARYKLLMQETADVAGDFAATSDDLANKERILTAELEDQKAALGEGLVPLYNQWLELQVALLPGLGELAQALGRVTGAFSEAQLAVQNIGTDVTDVGAVLDSFREDSINPLAVFSPIALFGEIRSFVTGRSMEEMIESFEEFLVIADLDREGLAEMSRQLAVLEQSGELTKEEMDALNEIITEQEERLASHSMAADADRALLGKYQTAQKDLGETIEEATEIQIDHAAAIQGVIDANNRAYSPVLRAIGAAKDAKTAQEEYTTALGKFKPGSEEAIEAAENLIEAQGNLDAALAQIVEEGGPNWREEFRRVASQAGIAEEDIAAMIDKVEEADGLTPTILLDVDSAQAQAILDEWIRRNSNIRITPTITPTRAIKTAPGRASGGPVTKGEGYVVGEEGEELFVPDSNGRIIPNAGGGTPVDLGGMGSNQPIIVQFIVDGQKFTDDVVVPALRRHQRRNGVTV